MCCFGDKKVRKIRFFSAPFSSSLAEGAKSVQGTCHVTLCLPVKFRPNRFRFAGVIPANVILYEHSIHVQGGPKNRTVFRSL